MATKPANLAKWQKDKTLYSIENLCATMNWLTSWINKFKFDKSLNLKLTGADQGKPIIKKRHPDVKIVPADDTNIVLEETTEETAEGTQKVIKVHLYYS